MKYYCMHILLSNVELADGELTIISWVPDDRD